MSSDEINLAAMAEMLTKSPDYRVLRRLMPLAWRNRARIYANNSG